MESSLAFHAFFQEQLATILRPTDLEAAAMHLEKACILAPNRPDLTQQHAALLEENGRLEEAADIYARILEQSPQTKTIQEAYNGILYRLGDETRFLSSYNRAPPTADLILSKAGLLAAAGRYEEAHNLYRTLANNGPETVEIAVGLAMALAGLADYENAAAVLEQAIRALPPAAAVWSSLAGVLAQAREPVRAAEAAGQALALDPNDQMAIALLGTSWRMRGDDDQEEALIGYRRFISAVDLDPPGGYRTTADFNAELAALLVDAHPAGREPLRQSLRGGTQTVGNLFERNLPALTQLRMRVVDAVATYVGGIAGHDHHFVRRRRRSFTFAGSWSSHLRSGGYHINHLHPGGWISACYYVAVPEDKSTAQEGWIKFGEPSFDVGLGPCSSLQPVPGRLILFPSYMWHGTIACHHPAPRTTVAFDLLPA